MTLFAPGSGRHAEPRGPGRYRQRGSALLIVFVFAAMVAIMLYMELPVAAFEAKREKEQVLIDRGHEYAHAVKLFVRKFGMYPATIDQLENTNRMRFLRHRFKDPFTGKEDWRMLHAGPGGALVDSKVQPAGGLSGLSNAGTSSGFGSSFGSTQNARSGLGSMQAASSGFGSTSGDMGTFGASSSTFSSGDTVVPPTPQRPPAISSSGGPSLATSTGENSGTAAPNEQSPTEPLLTPSATDQATNVGQPGNAAPTPPGASDSQNATNTMRQMLNSPGAGNPAIGAPLAGSAGTGTPTGQIAGGGIAGVASIAKGTSIKTVNDQTNYSLWEFYYDPSKDATRNMPGTGQPGAQQPGAVTPGANPAAGTQSGFGSSSGFSQSTIQSTAPASSSPSSFGAPQTPPQ